MTGFRIAPEPAPSTTPATAIVVPERPAAVLVGLAAVLAIVLTDVALGPGLQVTGLLTTPPFVSAVFVNPRRTAFVGLVSIAANVALAAQSHVLTQNTNLIRMGGVVLAAILAVALTVVREREQARALTIGHIAEMAQLAVLRRLPPSVGRVAIGVRYVSASAEARVGGDFYEALPSTRGTRAIVGDVRGKGLEAVQLANVLIGAFRGADHDRLSLAEVAVGLDAAFTRFEPTDEAFATAVLLNLAPDGTLTVVNCGHPAPLLVHDGAVSLLTPPAYALPLGLGSRPKPLEVALAEDDRVLLYTDGITEARVRGTMFDLEANAPPLAEGTIDEALDHLVASLQAFVQRRISDDVALMLVQQEP